MKILNFLIACVIFTSFLSSTTDAQGNGNILSLRTTPYDEVVPIPHLPPPFYIKDRIYTFIDYFFEQPQDKAVAEAVLMTIWYYNKVYNMLELMDRMQRKQYAYAGHGEECVGDAKDNASRAILIQRGIEDTMHKPEFIEADDFFFKVDAWWEIVGNTVDNIWNKNQLIARKVCDFRRRGLMCLKGIDEELRCGCAKDKNGVQMAATKGGICGIEKDKPCSYNSSSRLMQHVYAMEVYNTISDNHLIFQTCFGNSFCTQDLRDHNITTCQCWPLITSETRAKRSVLLNYSIIGSRCDRAGNEQIIKWSKWFVALTIIWIMIPLVLILAPHWDDFFVRVIPGYYKHVMMGDRSDGLPEKLRLETYDVKMNDVTRNFIEENAMILDVDDPEYFDKVDAVDDRELDPLDRFILVPQCTDKSYHFEWPVVDKLTVWF